MSTISRSQIVEYILYTLQHGSENLTRQNAYNFLRTLYAERNIAVDEDFTSEMLALKDLYKSITKIYKQDPKKIDQFLKATQKSIKENKDETFEGFPYQSTFQDFYKSVRRAMGNLIAYNKIIEESSEIKRKNDEAEQKKREDEQVRREDEDEEEIERRLEEELTDKERKRLIAILQRKSRERIENIRKKEKLAEIPGTEEYLYWKRIEEKRIRREGFKTE